MTLVESTLVIIITFFGYFLLEKKSLRHYILKVVYDLMGKKNLKKFIWAYDCIYCILGFDGKWHKSAGY